MKRRKIMIGVMLLLILIMAVSGCKKGEKGKKKSSELEVIDWAIAGLSLYETEDKILETTKETLNPMLIEKGKDYQIKFHFLTFKNGKLSAEDEEILRKCDLITMNNQFTMSEGNTQSFDVKWHTTLADYVDDGLFEPLDEYMNSENGRKIKEKMLSDLVLEQGYWDGKQWLLPTELPTMFGPSLWIDKNFYEKSGMEIDTVPDFTKCDELFEKLYIANGRKPFLTFSDRKHEGGANGIPTVMPFYLYDMFIGCVNICAEDVLGAGYLKSAESDLDVKNLLKEPYFEEYLNAWKRYIDKGYVHSNMNDKALVEFSQTNKLNEERDKIDREEWYIPQSENYILYLRSQSIGTDPRVGINAESEQKQLAFDVLADMILDKELSEIINSFYMVHRFAFNTGLSEEGEKEYLELLTTIPRYRHEHTFDTFNIPEIEEINKVYAEYSTEESDDSAQKVLERHFSKDGKVTEESIHEGIQRLNEKLDAAGMEKLIEALKEQKLKSER